MARVLQLIDSGGLYGAERVVLALLQELATAEHSAILGCICEQGVEDSPLAREALSKGIPIAQFPMRRGLSVKGIRAISRYVRENGIQVIHAHGYKADLFARFIRVPNVRKMATVHGWSKQDLGIKGKLYRLLDTAALKGMDKVIAVSEAIAHDLQSRTFAAEKVAVIHNGIAVDPATAKVDRIALRNRFALGQSDFVIACVGRLANVKGHKYLIEAVDLLLKEHPDCCLVIAGDGPLRPQIEAMIADRKRGHRIRLVGFTTDISAFLAMSDVFVLPSLSEGLPISLLEAMASGLPVVASAVGGICEVVTSPEYGVLVAPADSAQLFGALKDLYQRPDRRKALGNAAIKLVREKFSAGVMALQYEAVYSNLASKKALSS
ncbi:MAG: glycosyltransferase [Rhodocyclaceae bacterium]